MLKLSCVDGSASKHKIVNVLYKMISSAMNGRASSAKGFQIAPAEFTAPHQTIACLNYF